MKRSKLLLLTAICVVALPFKSQAVTLGESSSPGSGTTSSSASSDSSDEKEIDLGTYTPKVTSLHSINALLAQEQDIYFLPSLEDFPSDLKESAAKVTSSDGKTHSFAAVYAGEFDGEVSYVSADSFTTKDGQKIPGSSSDNTGRLLTTKKVYDSTDSSRALTLMGYDLLLRNEYCTITTDGKSAGYRFVYLAPQEILVQQLRLAGTIAAVATSPIIIVQSALFVSPALNIKHRIPDFNDVQCSDRELVPAILRRPLSESQLNCLKEYWLAFYNDPERYNYVETIQNINVFLDDTASM